MGKPRRYPKMGGFSTVKNQWSGKKTPTIFFVLSTITCIFAEQL